MSSYKIFLFISAKKQCFILLFFNLSGIWAIGENLPSNWLPQFHFLSITTLHDSFCILYISFPVYIFHAISVSHSKLIPKLFTLSYFYTCLQQFSSLTLVFRSSLALSTWSTNMSINTPTLFKKQTKIFNLYWIWISRCLFPMTSNLHYLHPLINVIKLLFYRQQKVKIMYKKSELIL